MSSTTSGDTAWETADNVVPVSPSSNDEPTAGERFSRRLRAPRFTVLPKAQLKALMNTAGGSARVELLDISAQGAKVSAGAQLEPGAEMTLYVKSRAGHELSLEGEVRWCAPCAAGLYRAGCFFPEPIEEQVLHELAVDGQVDRRDSPRRAVQLRGAVRRELDGAADEAVTVLDYSSQGLRFRGASQFGADERLLIVLGEGQRANTVPVRTVWSRQIGDHCETGCTFVHRAGHAAVHEYELASQPRILQRAAGLLEMAGVWWVGLTAIIALGFLGSLQGLRMLIQLWAG